MLEAQLIVNLILLEANVKNFFSILRNNMQPSQNKLTYNFDIRGEYTPQAHVNRELTKYGRQINQGSKGIRQWPIN